MLLTDQFRLVSEPLLVESLLLVEGLAICGLLRQLPHDGGALALKGRDSLLGLVVAVVVGGGDLV